jgi:hypothetical protein
MADEPWYEQLRERWRPERVRLLIIDEAAPELAADAKHEFFYSPTVVSWDPLFRAVVEVYFDGEFPPAGADKAPYLERLRDEGVYVIEAIPFPVGAYSRAERPHLTARFGRAAIERAAALQPEGVLVAFNSGFRSLGPGLKAAGLRLLHDGPVPFPRGRYRDQFLAGLKAAVARQAEAVA